MKKLAAILLVLLTLAFAGAAVAEDLTAVVEGAFDGVWMQYEDGFEIYLPGDWLQHEVTEDLLASGIFDVYTSADESQAVMLAWQGLDAEIAIADLCAGLQDVYPGAEVIEVNGIEMIFALDSANDTEVIIAMDGAEPGYYMFMFMPASDEAFVNDIAPYIALSIRNIE